VAQVLKQAPERFVILGTSFGGRVAMELTLAAPERVSGLVVIGARPGPVADARAGVRRSERLRGGEFEQVITEMGISSHICRGRMDRKHATPSSACAGHRVRI
jgi:pimeloyl-ACP methyl ester carboxylesterase